MKKVMTAIVMVACVAASAMAAERKPLEQVDVDELTGDTQSVAKGSGDHHLALAWWLPRELWESIMLRDAGVRAADRKALLDAMAGVSIVAVVQADASALGAMAFYSKDEIERTMSMSYVDAEGGTQRLQVLQKLNPDLEIVLGMMRPILSAAMGNLGSNMHFFVVQDRAGASRLLDPYQPGKLEVQLTRKDGVVLDAGIDMPVNALFVPRVCPDGRQAHISWNYCPWDGTRLN